MKTIKHSNKRVAGPVSVADILGPVRKVVSQGPDSEPGTCCVCQHRLDEPRILALRILGTPLLNWACVKCSPAVTGPRLGIFMGEVGTSELRIVDRIYSDSVRDIFMDGSELQEEED